MKKTEKQNVQLTLKSAIFDKMKIDFVPNDKRRDMLSRQPQNVDGTKFDTNFPNRITQGYRPLSNSLKYSVEILTKKFMLDQIYIQMQAMQVLSRTQDVTADNLANINTPGFKGNKVFYNLVREELNGEEVFKSVPQTHVDLSQGILEPTGNELDIAINGDGFFMVEEDGQKFLTRDGRFRLDSDGNLVNGNGASVLGDSGPINLAELFRTTNNDGGTVMLEVSKDGSISVNNKVIDKLQIKKVEDPALLERQGSAYFTVKDEIELKDEGTGTVMQGFYEKGNVSPLNEMVSMMRTMQTFESQQRALKTTDEMLGQATARLGRI